MISIPYNGSLRCAWKRLEKEEINTRKLSKALYCIKGKYFISGVSFLNRRIIFEKKTFPLKFYGRTV